MSNRTLIALDIDGVLNTYDDALMMQPYRDDEIINRFRKEILFYLPTDGNLRLVDLGMFVNTQKLEILHSIIENTDSDIMGISSWFGTRGGDITIAAFLGIPLDRFVISSSTGGGKHRTIAVANAIQDQDYDRLLILDDQTEFWDQYGLDKHRASINGRSGLTASLLPEIYNILKTPVYKPRILLELT